MVFSKKAFFEVKLIDGTGKEYKEFYSKDKSINAYVVGEKESEFMIKVSVESSKLDDKEVYGSKLYIDGQEVPGIKTFKKTGRYFGFKMGGGVYKKFIFGSPSFDIEEQGGNRDIGKIRIIFYTTKEFNVGRRVRYQPHSYQPRSRTFLDSNKKLCFKSLQVFEGTTFDNGHTTRQRIKQRNERQVQHIIDFQDDIDDAEFSYSDFYGLIAMGMISTNNIKDLSFLPNRNLDYNALGNALNTIILDKKNDDNNISIKALHEQFYAICEHDLALYYANPKYQTLQNLIKTLYSDRFEIVNNDYVKPISIIKCKDIIANLNRDNNLLNKEYLLTGNQMNLHNKRVQERSFRKNGDLSSRMNVEVSEIVDLTCDDIEID